MTVEQKIKEFLDRKINLERNIAEARRCLEHVDRSDLITNWTRNNYRIDIRMEQEIWFGALHKQINKDVHELDEINRKLHAIGSLMGLELNK